MKLILLILLLPFGVFANTMSYSVSPGILKFETVKGSLKSFDLTVLNQGEDRLNIEANVMNLTLDRLGVPIISKITAEKFQWGRFVQLEKNKFKLNPNSSKKINVLLRTPRGASGAGYFAVVFNVSSEKKSSNRQVVKNLMSISSQMPVIFLGKVSRLGHPNIHVEKAIINKAPYSKSKPLKLRFTLKNNGNTHVNVNGDVLLRHNKKVIERIKLDSGSGLIFPDGERYFVGTSKKYDNYANKKISAEGRFSYPGGRANKKITFTVK